MKNEEAGFIRWRFGIFACLNGGYLLFRDKGRHQFPQRECDGVDQTPSGSSGLVHQAKEQCPEAVFSMPTSGFIGFLWDDFSAPVTATPGWIFLAGLNRESHRFSLLWMGI